MRIVSGSGLNKMQIQDLTPVQIKTCYRIIQRCVSSSITFEHVEDVTHDVWERALKSLGSCKDETRLSAWVAKIARRAVADYYRPNEKLSRAYRNVALEIRPKDTDADQDSMLIFLELMKIAEEGERKPRGILFERFANGRTYREIGEKNGANKGAIWSQYLCEIGKLRDILMEGGQ